MHATYLPMILVWNEWRKKSDGEPAYKRSAGNGHGVGGGGAFIYLFTICLILYLMSRVFLSQKFQLFDTVMTLPAALSADREPIDFDISVIFRCLDVQSVLLVLTSILTQQRIVFTSSSCPLLALVTKVSSRLLAPTLCPVWVPRL